MSKLKETIVTDEQMTEKLAAFEQRIMTFGVTAEDYKILFDERNRELFICEDNDNPEAGFSVFVHKCLTEPTQTKDLMLEIYETTLLRLEEAKYETNCES